MDNTHTSNGSTDSWKPFSGQQNGRTGHFGLRVTIDKNSTLFLTENTWRALGEPEAVEFFINEEAEAVGMKKADPEMESSFLVKPQTFPRSRNGYRISASSFFTHHNIKTLRTVRFNRVTLNPDGMMTFSLKSVTTVTRGSR